MRPIYWGLVFTFLGMCSLALLILVASSEQFVEESQLIALANANTCKPMPAFYIALIYVTKFMMYLSLPFATVIEARCLLKERRVNRNSI